MAVKVDNAPAGRPQSGLQEAEAVYELPVEGNFTRFIALFHAVDSDYVGPIRSIRPTDSSLVVPLGATIQMSGGQPYVLSLVRSDGTHVLPSTGPGATFRIEERKAPLNLFGNTAVMRERADARNFPDEAPPPIATFGEPTSTTGDVSRVDLDFSSFPPVNWRWSGERYWRFNGDELHTWRAEDGTIGPVAVDTLLILLAQRYIVSPPTIVKDGKLRPDGSPVPAFRTTGSGRAILLYDGGIVEGTWDRQKKADPFNLTLEDGTPMVVPPGQLWITIFPTNRELTLK